MKFKQQPGAVMMIRPATFGFNPQTAESNAFQKMDVSASVNDTAMARDEFNRMTDLLEAHEIDVRIFDDTIEPAKPDAIFPNNWISFHGDGTVVLYPMLAPNRRIERRHDIIEKLRTDFEVRRVIDLSPEEEKGNFLEGTGSVVFDHVNKIGYACRSPRTSEELVNRLCRELKYTPMVFDAVDEKGQALYHTNVMMCVGEKFAIVCLDSIHNDDDQERVLESFSNTGHKVVAISYAQLRAFAGNMIEVNALNNEPVVLLSETAFASLLPGQLNAISQFAAVLPLKISGIESRGGGSVRCMVAGIHLPTLNAI